MGLPFLVFAWLMLIQFSSAVSGRKISRWFLPVFLILNFSLLFILGYYIARENSSEPETLNRYYFMFMNVAYSLLASYIIHLSGKSRAAIHENDRKVLAPLISVISVIQCVPLVFYKTEPWPALVFIFVFFTGSAFLPVYFSYCTILPSGAVEAQQDLTFDEFCKKYEISPRESDIILEICNGLTNKEISEKLFISLQTVKDHTHRIYIKTNVKSRVQLINLVKNEKIR
jgi:DNA-binding CsgD family transcriptional regulator